MKHNRKRLALLVSMVGLGLSPFAPVQAEEDEIPDVAAAPLPVAPAAAVADADAIRGALGLADEPAAAREPAAPVSTLRLEWILGLHASELMPALPAHEKPSRPAATPSIDMAALALVAWVPEPPSEPMPMVPEGPQPVPVEPVAMAVPVREPREVSAALPVPTLLRGNADTAALDEAPWPQAPTFRGEAVAETHLDRVLENLAAVRAEDPFTAAAHDAGMASDEAPATTVDTVAPWPSPTAAPEIVVATPSEQVLLTLAAVLSEDRADAGWSVPEPIVVATHSEKVLLTLAAISSGPSPQPAIEPAQRVPVEPAAHPMGVGWQRVAASQLDTVRGGFTGVNGLRVSFGIESAVYVNGNLVTTTSFNVNDLGNVSGGRAVTVDPATLTLVQNGAGNVFTSNATPAAIGTVIQNTLNDQKIQNITVINATVNSMDILKSINLQSTLRNAVTDSLRR